MTKPNTYFLGTYKRTEIFLKEPEIPALTHCKEHIPEFFPAKFYTAPKTFVELAGPSDFSRSLAPLGYYSQEEADVVSFYGAQDECLSFAIEKEALEYAPSSILLDWNESMTLPSTIQLENLLMSFIEEFQPELAFITNKEIFHSDEIEERPYFDDDEMKILRMIHWITWLTPRHLEKLGRSKIESIKDIVKVQDCAGGVLITLMPEPFENENPKHQAIRIEVEDRLGLMELYKLKGVR